MARRSYHARPRARSGTPSPPGERLEPDLDPPLRQVREGAANVDGPDLQLRRLRRLGDGLRQVVGDLGLLLLVIADLGASELPGTDPLHPGGGKPDLAVRLR